jgi:hypothetical protein
MINRELSIHTQFAFCPKQITSREHSLLPENFPEIVDTAVELRRECPSRSVNDIIRIMELENLHPEGHSSKAVSEIAALHAFTGRY